MRSPRIQLIARLFVAALCCAALTGCHNVEKRISASHFRDWVPEQAMLPYVEYHGNQVTVHNVRNNKYFANDVYMVDYYDKTFDLNAVRSVDYVVVPFAGMPALAHTMLSFEIMSPTGKPEHLALSVEV